MYLYFLSRYVWLGEIQGDGSGGLYKCNELSRNRCNNIGLEFLWAKMKVMQLSRCCLFNKNCLLRSASSNFCRGESKNLTKGSTKVTHSRWITSGPSKVRTLACPQNVEGGFSRAPIFGRFKAFLFRMKNPKFKFWDAVDGCKEVGHCILFYIYIKNITNEIWVFWILYSCCWHHTDNTSHCMSCWIQTGYSIYSIHHVTFYMWVIKLTIL